MKHLEDTELVTLTQNGNGQAFDILINRYQTKITRLVYRYVQDSDIALDLVQDIFFKAFRNLKKFKGDSKFSSWLFRVAINESIDHLRRIKIRGEQSLDLFRETGFDVPDRGSDQDIAGNYETAQEQHYIRQALEALPGHLKTVVVMKIYQEMTFDDIAEILQEPVSTVKSRLYKALQSLGGVFRQRSFIEKRGQL